MSDIGRKVGSHNVWSQDQSEDRPISPFFNLQIIIKKGYVVFIILYVKKVDNSLYFTPKLYVIIRYFPKFLYV